jgi:hypothetical protein
MIPTKSDRDLVLDRDEEDSEDGWFMQTIEKDSRWKIIIAIFFPRCKGSILDRDYKLMIVFSL